ncbi:MAG: PIN domain-containing protein [Myxococcota bacterium]
MIRRALLDTGPLVAFLNAADDHHAWAREALAGVEPPMATCESVLSEACFLLRRSGAGTAAVVELVARGLLVVPYRLEPDAESVRRLLVKYADVPMALADACLVRMAEVDAQASVVTLDRDFLRYRRNGRHVLRVIAPFSA